MLGAKFKIGLLALGISISSSFLPIVAWADDTKDVLARLQSLEKELEALKKENEALRQIKRLRQENTKLAKLQPAGPHRNPQDAYAADMPGYYKAAPLEMRGSLKLWAEGGSIWTGGDPIDSFYSRSTVTSGPSIDIRSLFFPLLPNIGWEAATGFDYAFAGSPWHVSGQFRYGEGRTKVTSGSASSLATSAGGAPPVIAGVTDAESVFHKETHWLADLAVGREVIGSGADAMQFKFGMRVAELRADTNSRASATEFVTGSNSDFLLAVDSNTSQQLKFFGVGPRLGLDGSVPLAGRWSFDYLGDVAALFGTQNFYQLQSAVITPPLAGFTSPPPSTAQKFATVLNTDVQVGASYWFSPNVKASLSYRLDAYFNVFAGLDAQNDPKHLVQINRYNHGPRLAVAAQF